MKRFFTLFFSFGLALNALCQFTTGNVVVLRMGTTGTDLNNTAREVFLDEFTPAGTLVSTLAIPTSGANQLTLQGTSSTEGGLSRSSNGAFLTLGGYALAVGTASPSSTATNASRNILRIDKSGAISNTLVPAASLFPNAAFRCVVTDDGSRYWASGGTAGIMYVAHGANTSTLISNTITNQRTAAIFNGQLYFTHASGTTFGRVMAVGTGLPTTTATTSNALPGLPASGSAGFVFFADLSDAIPGVDVMYLADDGQGLLKYSLVGGTWVSSGSTGSPADAYRGLTGVVNGTAVTLYATRKGGTGSTGGGELVKIEDATGYNATITAQAVLLATAAVNTAFRGVAMAPTDAVQPLALISFSASRRAASNLLQWRTTKEINTAKFDIESSTNGLNFNGIGKTLALGNQSTNDYEFSDISNGNGVVFYRLKMVDKDGSFKYSHVVSLAATTGSKGFSIWPNPTKSSPLNLRYPTTKEKGYVQIFAADGKLMATYNLPAGSFQTSINISQLKTGIYKLFIYSSGDRSANTLVVE